LTKALPRLIRAFDPVVRSDGARLSEDFAFCHRWRTLCGGEVWASVAHRITHVGLHHFAARFSDTGGDTKAAQPRLVVSPKMGKSVKGRIDLADGAKRSEPKADVRPGTKTISIRLKDKTKTTRQ
jgi:hypothetical protein